MVISMLKIRRPLGRLIFNMGIAIPGKTVFLIETAHRCTKSHDFPEKIGNILISSNLIEIWSEMTGWGDDWLFAFEHHNVLLNKSAWTS